MKKNSSVPFLLVLMVIVFATFSVISVEARKNHSKKSRAHQRHQKQRNQNKHHSNPPSGPSPAPLPHDDAYPTQSNKFNILSFGAKGDGVSDDSKALTAAWEAACKVTGATLQIPSAFMFLIKPITLQGPCMPDLILQIDGTLLAPPSIGEWPKSSLFQWMNFKWAHNFTIQGTGIVDGQGCNWWGTTSQIAYTQKRSTQVPGMKPTALRFYSSYNVTVREITIKNSAQCHLKFDNSGQVNINNITISAPENSPNTDGIHLQNTQDVEIQHSSIGSGDDCVSIQTGCSNVHVHHINCGPGHGISIGGLGKDRSVACVSDIIIDNVNMQKTMFGVRIKTWQGGIGSVKNVSFSNIAVADVMVPIVIDQYYCDKNICKNQTGAVAISGVKYDNIIGTYSAQPIRLACSSSRPCTDVDLIDIQLKPSSLYYKGYQQALCLNSYGKSQAPLVPSTMDYCLRGGGVKIVERSHESIC